MGWPWHGVLAGYARQIWIGKGATMKFANKFMGLLASAGSLAWSSAAHAEGGIATPWQLGLQEGVTPISAFIHTFHFWLLILITIIALFVLGLMIYAMVKFNAKANPVPSKTTHNTMIEVVWTVVPILILVAIAIIVKSDDSHRYVIANDTPGHGDIGERRASIVFKK